MTVYLDHAASTPLRVEARDAWLDATGVVGNASSVHRDGQAARSLLEGAREQVARAMGCDPIEVLFTSGGTESVNAALKGLWWGRPPATESIVLPDGEHHATLDTVEWLRSTEKATVRAVPLTPLGAVDIAAFVRQLPGSALATALVANNEVGTLSEATRMAEAAADADVALHLDAVGAAGILDVQFSVWRGRSRAPSGLVALSLSGHKVGAPVGTGALLVSRHARIAPLVHGGGQQRGLRAGTQDIAGAAALAAALTAAVAERDEVSARLVTLRQRLIDGVRRTVPAAELLGDPRHRLPGNAHFRFPGAAGETLLFLLDQRGVSVSTGSACQAGVTEPSHVVLALGRDERAARSVLRFTLGRGSTAEDVDVLLAALPEAYERAVAAGGGPSRLISS